MMDGDITGRGIWELGNIRALGNRDRIDTEKGGPSKAAFYRMKRLSIPLCFKSPDKKREE
jgi:hypothetical protein